MNAPAEQQQNVLGDLDALERIERFAQLMASARVSLPKELQDNPGDCLAIALQAAAWQMNPFAVAQKSYIIKGKIGYEAQLVNAIITRHAPIQGRLQFDYSDGWEKVLGHFRMVKGQHGDYPVSSWQPEDEQGLWCQVSATLVDEQQPRIVRVQLVQAQPRQSTQWATDPKQQLAYVTLKRWARLHCPDVILGIYTPDEMAAREPDEKDVTPLKAALDKQGDKLTARKEREQPSAGTATDRPDGQKLTGTKTTPENTHTEHTESDTDAQNRADRIRQRLREQNQVPVAEPGKKDLDDRDTFLEVIRNCTTLAELEEAGQSFSGQIHPDYVGQVKKAYKRRRDELKQA